MKPLHLFRPKYLGFSNIYSRFRLLLCFTLLSCSGVCHDVCAASYKNLTHYSLMTYNVACQHLWLQLG